MYGKDVLSKQPGASNKANENQKELARDSLYREEESKIEPTTPIPPKPSNATRGQVINVTGSTLSPSTIHDKGI
jgi:hypothetical protein